MGVNGSPKRGFSPQGLGPGALTASAWTLGLVTTALVVGTPYLVFGYYNPDLHLVLDSVDACIALLLAYLLYGRYLRSQRRQDLLLFQGLLLLGVASLGSALAAPVFGVATSSPASVWLPLTVRVAAAALIAIAALSSSSAATRLGRLRFVPLLVVFALTLGIWLVRDLLPQPLAASPPASATRPVIDGHWLLLGAQSFSAICFLVASVWFVRQSSSTRDELLRWLGPACALGGFARVNYVLFPSLYSDWIYTGDVLRTASYVVLLVGAGREIRQHWAAQARVAVLEDRRRLARELHDGVVQELGYIRAETYGLSAVPALQQQRILAACDRATDEARAAVDALGSSGDEPLGFVLQRAAREVAERYGGRVDVELDDAVDADADQRHALVRIVREAVSNALRHGQASRVRVHLRRDAETRQLLVHDDGDGFSVDDREHNGGFGLTSMRDRAAGLPGSLDVASSPGEGTTVSVTW